MSLASAPSFSPWLVLPYLPSFFCPAPWHQLGELTHSIQGCVFVYFQISVEGVQEMDTSLPGHPHHQSYKQDCEIRNLWLDLASGEQFDAAAAENIAHAPALPYAAPRF